MSGIRIAHPIKRNTLATIVEGDRPYPAPFSCPPPPRGCGGTHVYKTYHIWLDETGAAIISDALFFRLRPILQQMGFVPRNEVVEPPPIRISAMVRPNVVALHHKVIRNGYLVVLDPSRRYPVPYDCQLCSQTHIYKAHHIWFDGSGEASIGADLYVQLASALTDCEVSDAAGPFGTITLAAKPTQLRR